MRKLILAVLALVVVAGVLLFVSNKLSSNTQGARMTQGDLVFCTTEVQQCPDGSYASRIPPACDFVACVNAGGATTTSATSTSL